MEKERFEEIEKKTDVFGFGKLQGLITLYALLKKEKISLKELQEYLKQKRTLNIAKEDEQRMAFKEAEELWEANAKRCPECGRALMLRPVSHLQGKSNIQGHQSHWYCIAEDCIHEEYSKVPYKELYLKVMEGK